MLGRIESFGRIFVAAAVVLVVGASPGAVRAKAGVPAQGSVVLEIIRGEEAPSWLAAALEEHLTRELSTYERLRVHRRDEAVRTACGPDEACIVRRYGDEDVDIVFVADINPAVLRYRLYETWTPSKVREGRLSLERLRSLIGLRQSLLRAFGPVLTPGGLLDQKPYRARLSPPPATQPRTVEAVHGALFLVALATFFLIPILVAVRSVVRSDQAPSPRARLVLVSRNLWPAGSVAVVALVGAAAAVVWGAPWSAVDVPDDARWLFGLIGGAAWGVFVMSNVRFAVPLLSGLDRVAHRDVFRLIRAWLHVGALRFAALSLYYLPFGWATVRAAQWLGLSPTAAIVFFAPVVGLGARLWLSTWIHALTLYLDQRLVLGEVGPDNPWHREVSQYFVGYLRRTGWSLEPEVLGAILFLPGRQPGVFCYGGGLVGARVVIDEPTLQLAMGLAEKAPEDPEEVALADWTNGVIVAGGPPPALRTHRRRAHGLSARLRDRLTSMTGHQRKQLGQAATLLGYVRPEPGERVPLIADTVEDLEVVRGLLSEHYQWFAPDPDEDHDDSDPTDKDFLFGLLTFAVGRVARKDSQLGTIPLAVQERADRSVRVVRGLHRAVRAVGGALIGRSGWVIADAYPALHYARHHHLQYLAYRWTDEDRYLTVRAGVDELERTSRAIFGQIRATRSEKAAETSRVRARFQKRMVWLSSFFAEPLVDKAERRIRWLAAAAVLLAVGAGIGASVYQAVVYHPSYVARIADAERRHRERRENKVVANEGPPSNESDQTLSD